VIVASTTAVAPTAKFTLGTSTDSLFGSLTFSAGSGGAPVTVNLLANTTLANTVIAINAAITAAKTAATAVATADTAAGNTAGATAATAQVTVLNSVVASASGAVLTITGPVDQTVNGTNTFVFSTIALDDIGTVGTAISFAYGVCRPIGCAVRNVYQYIGGVLVGQNTAASPSATGINYVLDGVVPINFNVLNYMHEMGTAIQTQFVLKLPWIGPTASTLAQDALTDGLVGYMQLFGRTFTHFTGGNTNAGFASGFSAGTGIVAASGGSGVPIVNGSTSFGVGSDAGNFAIYNPAVNSPMDIVGRVLDVQNLAPVGFLNRVRTLFDRPMVGPMVDPNPAAIRMGGSATGGIPYHISVTTDAIFKRAYDQGKTLRPEYSTHVIVRVNL
jgi:hypothetical protein